MIKIKNPRKEHKHTHTETRGLQVIAHIFLISHAWGKQISDGFALGCERDGRGRAEPEGKVVMKDTRGIKKKKMLLKLHSGDKKKK